MLHFIGIWMEYGPLHAAVSDSVIWSNSLQDALVCTCRKLPLIEEAAGRGSSIG